MNCACQVVNNSGLDIAALVLFHAADVPLPSGVWETVSNFTDLASGTTSATVTASQTRFTDDWWAMGLQFSGDGTLYLLANGLLPYAECETPGGGSVQIVIGPGFSGFYTCTINTFKHSDFTHSDGDCSEQVVTQDTLKAEDEAIQKLIEMIADAVEELL